MDVGATTRDIANNLNAAIATLETQIASDTITVDDLGTLTTIYNELTTLAAETDGVTVTGAD